MTNVIHGDDLLLIWILFLACQKIAAVHETRRLTGVTPIPLVSLMSSVHAAFLAVLFEHPRLFASSTTLHKSPVYILLCSFACQIPCPPHHPCFHHPHDILRREQPLKILAVQFFRSVIASSQVFSPAHYSWAPYGLCCSINVNFSFQMHMK
jgi:hypothetical protein